MFGFFFFFLAVMKDAAMNTHMQIFVCTLYFLGFICRSRVAGSYGNTICNVLRNCQTVFQSR